MAYKKYDNDSIRKAVEVSESIAGVMRCLGIPYISGGMHGHIKRRIQSLGVDTSHFLGQGHNKNRVGNNRLPAKEILILDRHNGRREDAKRLRMALDEMKIPRKCTGCGLTKDWNGKPIVLEIDHINRNPVDNRFKNLRYLCPNCHSQRPSVGTADESALEVGA